MNIIVAVLANMTRYCSCRSIAKLNSEPISEKTSIERVLYVFMVR